MPVGAIVARQARGRQVDVPLPALAAAAPPGVPASRAAIMQRYQRIYGIPSDPCQGLRRGRARLEDEHACCQQCPTGRHNYVPFPRVCTKGSARAPRTDRTDLIEMDRLTGGVHSKRPAMEHRGAEMKFLLSYTAANFRTSLVPTWLWSGHARRSLLQAIGICAYN